MASGIVAGEEEKRKLRQKLSTDDKKLTVKWLLKTALLGLKSSSELGSRVVLDILDYASELPLHRLIPVTLCWYALCIRRSMRAHHGSSGSIYASVADIGGVKITGQPCQRIGVSRGIKLYGSADTSARTSAQRPQEEC